MIKTKILIGEIMNFEIMNDIMEEFEETMEGISYSLEEPFSEEIPSPDEIYEAIWECHHNKEYSKMNHVLEMDKEFANNHFNDMN